MLFENESLPEQATIRFILNRATRPLLRQLVVFDKRKTPFAARRRIRFATRLVVLDRIDRYRLSRIIDDRLVRLRQEAERSVGGGRGLGQCGRRVRSRRLLRQRFGERVGYEFLDGGEAEFVDRPVFDPHRFAIGADVAEISGDRAIREAPLRSELIVRVVRKPANPIQTLFIIFKIRSHKQQSFLRLTSKQKK